MTEMALAPGGHAFQALTPGTVQTVTISGTSAATSSTFSSEVVRVVSTTNCHYHMAASPTATTSLSYLPLGEIEYLRCIPGVSKLAFIQNSAGGTAYVTEMT